MDNQPKKKKFTVNVEHHLPHSRPYGLVEAEPDLSSSSQGVVVTLRG